MKTLRDYIPAAKWEAWKPLSRRERALQIANFCVETLKVRETSGPNRGEVLDAIQRTAGYDPENSYPWCAMYVFACAVTAGYKASELPTSPGAVARWRRWAEQQGRLTKRPQRGDLCFWLNRNGTGHMGFVVSANLLTVTSLEGNTSSGDVGSQRDGDGAFRRTRLRTTWKGFIRLPD